MAETLGKYFASIASFNNYDQKFQAKIRKQQNSIQNQIPIESNRSEINLPFSMDELSFA